MDECEEIDCSSVVSCGDAAEVLELIEASFDAVSRLVDFEVVGNQALSGWVAGDDGGGASIRDETSEVIAVIGFVGEDMIWLEAIEQRRRLRHVTGLSGCKNDP